MKEIIITKNDSNQRLDKYLKRYLTNASTSFLYKMLRKKNIVLNDKKAIGSEIIKENDSIKIYFSDETYEKITTANAENDLAIYKKYKDAYLNFPAIEIIYENEHILLLNKPAGILTQKAEQTDSSVNEWLIGYLLSTHQISKASLAHFKPSVLNRLDRNTSGIVICGKTLYGSQKMSLLIKERKIQKFYRLLLSGNMQGSGVLLGYLKKDTDSNIVKIYNELPNNDTKKDYSAIETHYNVINSSSFCSYLEVELITGKTHQIRAHFASIGHPLLGDYKYGNKEINQKMKSLGVTHQMLHAYRLNFPVMEQELQDLSEREFFCSEPDIFSKIINTQM